MARPTFIWSLRTGGWLLLFAAGLCVFALVGSLLAAGMSPAHAEPVLVVGGAAFATSIVLTLMWLRRRERQRADLLRSNFRRCPSCFHDLRGLAHHGQCPECGQEFGDHMLETLW